MPSTLMHDMLYTTSLVSNAIHPKHYSLVYSAQLEAPIRFGTPQYKNSPQCGDVFPTHSSKSRGGYHVKDQRQFKVHRVSTAW